MFISSPKLRIGLWGPCKYYADMDFNDIPVKDLVSKELRENRI